MLLIALELKRAFTLKGYCVFNELDPGNLTGMTRNEEGQPNRQAYLQASWGQMGGCSDGLVTTVPAGWAAEANLSRRSGHIALSQRPKTLTFL